MIFLAAIKDTKLKVFGIINLALQLAIEKIVIYLSVLGDRYLFNIMVETPIVSREYVFERGG